MPKILIALFAIVIAIAGPSWAGQKVVQYERLLSCTPGTVDGSQVIEPVFAGGDCNGKKKVVLRITDFTLEAICSIEGLACVHKSQMDAEQLVHYERMKAYRKPMPEFAVCVQRHDTWLREMITSKPELCSPGINAARSYESVLRRGCVWFGSAKIGCVELTREQIDQAFATESAQR